MKKFLLSAAALMAAMSMNAQVESAFIDADNVFAGIEETKWTDDKGKEQSGYPVEAGHVLCASDNVTMKIAYQENGKITALAGENDNAKTVTIGGVTYKATKGVTGNQNPTASITEASTNGFVIQFDVKKDGYIYAICKLSSNKPYYVWEGKAGEGEALVAYSLTMHMLDETTPIGAELNYTLPADADGYFDASAADADKYTDGTALRWPEKIVLGAEAADVKKNGLGIIKFPVYADAETYLLHATGSKVSIDGFVFSPTELEMKVNKVGEEPEDNPEPQPGGDVETLKVAGAEGAMDYAGTWAGNWWNLNETMDLDVSSYDYLWIDYDGFEGAIQFGIFYSEWQKTESWGEVWYTDQIDLTEPAGIVGIKIEKTKTIEKGVGGADSEFKGDIYAKHARQVFTQDKGKPSKINIKGIYLGSEAAYNAAKNGSTGIQNAKAQAQKNAIRYNLAGQKVDANYKGIVIENGKKFMIK